MFWCGRVKSLLQSGSELIKILRALSQTHGEEPDLGSQQRISQEPRDGPSQSTPYTTPATLMLLSCYMQLLQLHDSVFRRVFSLLRDTPKNLLGSCALQSESHVRIAGLDTVDGRLHIKFLIQSIEHHVETIEELLHVPARSRLSNRDASPTEPLDQTDSSELVRVAMAQVGHGSTSSSGSDLDQPLMASLRESIGKVKDLLR